MIFDQVQPCYKYCWAIMRSSYCDYDDDDYDSVEADGDAALKMNGGGTVRRMMFWMLVEAGEGDDCDVDS